MQNAKIFKMPFSKVYPLYINKVERKGQKREDVDVIISWLTGYDEGALKTILKNDVDFEQFFAEAPALNPNIHKITGVVCGIRVENVEDELMQKIRYLDKLVDELARGKAMEKILRK